MGTVDRLICAWMAGGLVAWVARGEVERRRPIRRRDVHPSQGPPEPRDRRETANDGRYGSIPLPQRPFDQDVD